MTYVRDEIVWTAIVIHDPVTPTTRLACVDLATEGGFLSSEVALQRGRNIMGAQQWPL